MIFIDYQSVFILSNVALLFFRVFKIYYFSLPVKLVNDEKATLVFDCRFEFCPKSFIERGRTQYCITCIITMTNNY
jgi:hypothetical protein